MDRFSKDKRRKIMKSVKSRESKIETDLAKDLWHNGCRYRRDDKTVYGNPDLTIKKLKIAIFVDGDFWYEKDWETKKNYK